MYCIKILITKEYLLLLLFSTLFHMLIKQKLHNRKLHINSIITLFKAEIYSSELYKKIIFNLFRCYRTCSMNAH